MSKIIVRKSGFRAVKKHVAAAPPPAKPTVQQQDQIIGKTVFFKSKDNGSDIAGVVFGSEGSMLSVKLCVPNYDGVLVMSQSGEVSVNRDFVTEVNADVVKNKDVKQYTGSMPISKMTRAVPIKEDDVVVDWKDVEFEGYASTFKNVTPEDRIGDYIMPNAFDRWISMFRKNPVLLCDHDRSTECLMGHFSSVDINQSGLYVVGKVTNSPCDEAVHIRFQLVEGSLKTLSIGGSFFYMDDFKGIEEVDLHEISLVTIPCNPDAMITTRSISTEYAEKAFKEFSSKNGGIVRQLAGIKNIA
jgi:HK97 family phage prohead protease